MSVQEIINHLIAMVMYTEEKTEARNITVLVSYALFSVLNKHYSSYFGYYPLVPEEKIHFMGYPLKVVIGEKNKLKYWISIEDGEFELSEAGGND